MDIKQKANDVRKEIKSIASQLKGVKSNYSFSTPNGDAEEDRGEVIANLTLAHRHLEDASMRLGKVMQAADGGVSVYDKETTVGANDSSNEAQSE